MSIVTPQLGWEMQLSTIECEGYRLECDASKGAILRSLTWRGDEVLRSSPDGSDDPLESAMFPLVPFSNRLSKDVRVGGNALSLPRFLQDCDFAIHGFGWQKKWLVEEQSEKSLRITLEDEESPWPSVYRAEQEFWVDTNGFHARLTVTNIGSDALPAGIGFHPYFPRADCLVTIGLDCKWEQDEFGLPAQKVQSGWDPFAHTAIANHRLDHSFSGWNGVAQLRWPTRNLAVEVVADEVLRELVIYSPKEDFFCLEPVSHLTNAMFAREEDRRIGWRVLDPGQSLAGTMSLRARRIA